MYLHANVLCIYALKYSSNDAVMTSLNVTLCYTEALLTSGCQMLETESEAFAVTSLLIACFILFILI